MQAAAEVLEAGGWAPPQAPQLDTLARLRRWTTAALEQFLLMMWEEMQQV